MLAGLPSYELILCKLISEQLVLKLNIIDVLHDGLSIRDGGRTHPDADLASHIHRKSAREVWSVKTNDLRFMSTSPYSGLRHTYTYLLIATPLLGSSTRSYRDPVRGHGYFWHLVKLEKHSVRLLKSFEVKEEDFELMSFCSAVWMEAEILKGRREKTR